MTKYYTKILSTGSYLPKKILSNKDIEKIVDTNDEWITTRTGIKERRIAETNEANSDMAISAAKNAITKANILADEIDTIIFATVTPDMLFPSTACILHKKLNMKNTPISFDISAACSGFVYGLNIADSMIRAGNSKTVLLIGSDMLSKFTNWKDRSTCILFGDGAGAMILTRTENISENSILSTFLGSDGNYDNLLYVPAGGTKLPASKETVEQNLHTVVMSGKEVFKVAVFKMVECMQKGCELAGIKPNDLDLFIPHQANLRIINAVGERINIDNHKIFINVHKYGNMSAATTIVSLDEAINEGRVKQGSIVGLVAFGSGFTWGSAVIKL